MSAGPGIPDGSRALNQTAFGVRYQGAFGGLGVLAYAVYECSGHAQYTGLTTPAVLGTAAMPGSKFNGSFNGLSFGSGGIAMTYAGFTVGGNAIGGKINGQLALQPQGGAPLLGYLLGAKYVNGPWTVGIVGEEYWQQGNVQLTGLSQRRGRASAPAHPTPLLQASRCSASTSGTDQYQSGDNFVTGAVGTGAAGRANGAEFNNNVKGQTFLIGNVVNF